MDNFSLFDEVQFWIPEVDNDCRMWKCPGCLRRVLGEPLGWYQFNYFNFCPYCGLRLFTKLKYVSDIDGLSDLNDVLS